MNNKEKKQSYLFYVGVDLSKEKFDAVSRFNCEEQQHRVFDNNKSGIKRFIRWLEDQDGFDIKHTLICMEHTGLYSRELVKALVKINAFVWIESPLQIKKSLGFLRGKSDKIDSSRIAYYAEKYTDKARLVLSNNEVLQKLQDLLSARDRLLKTKGQLQRPLNELKRIDKATYQDLIKINRPVINQLNKSLAQIKKEILTVINSDESIKRQYQLVCSVKGVGMVLGVQLMVYTHGFTRMQNGRQLACYAGVAPFEHTSGSSIKGRTHTSNFANMTLKSTLHLAAISSIQHNPDLKKYYERKVGEGKSKMCVINAVRAKLLYRVLAVVKRGTPYQNVA
ncbi:IS110 family transposase [Bacteroidota bacterium]